MQEKNINLRCPKIKAITITPTTFVSIGLEKVSRGEILTCVIVLKFQ